MSGTRPTALDIFAARRRLAPYLSPTPLRSSAWLSERSGAVVALKLESLQPTNAFKIRGALNAVLQLQRTHADRPVPTIVTASAGNHGRAIALAAERTGMRAIVFTPADAPETKKSAIRRHGAELRDDCADYDAAEEAARAFARSSGGVFISAYNHADVIAGAGTIGLELMEQLPELQTVVAPLGGGGLTSGIAIALRAIKPAISIVAVEVEASRAFATGVAQGRIVPIEPQPSLADGLTGNLEPASVTFDLVREHVDRITAVNEDDLREAIRGLAAEEHLIAEGAGATAAAGVLTKKAGIDPGTRVGVLVTGGNIDLERFGAIVRA